MLHVELLKKEKFVSVIITLHKFSDSITANFLKMNIWVNYIIKSNKWEIFCYFGMKIKGNRFSMKHKEKLEILWKTKIRF